MISVAQTVECVDYFQVGGEISAKVIQKMNEFGRIAVCGAVSTYNEDPMKSKPCTEIIIDNKNSFKIRMICYIVS